MSKNEFNIFIAFSEISFQNCVARLFWCLWLKMSPADVWRKLFFWHKCSCFFTLLPKIKIFFCIISLLLCLQVLVYFKSISFYIFTIYNLFKQMLFCACAAVFDQVTDIFAHMHWFSARQTCFHCSVWLHFQPG